MSMPAHLCESPLRIEIRHWSDRDFPGRATTEISLSSFGQAQEFLQRHCRDALAVLQLRSLLARDIDWLPRLGDHDVLHEVALRLASGRLLAVSIASPASFLPAALPEAASSPNRSTGPAAQSPSSLAAPRTAARPAAAPAAAAPEPQDGIDQDAQAQALESAARDGIPFCAVCAQAQARSAGQAAPA
jgi:hypothetical protein